jgi:hypothetical protein
LKKPPHKAKASHTGRKYYRNYIGRDKKNLSKYVARMKRRGTFRERKGITKTRTQSGATRQYRDVRAHCARYAVQVLLAAHCFRTAGDRVQIPGMALLEL